MTSKATQGPRVRAMVSDPWLSAPERLYLKETGLSVDARLTLMYALDLARRPGWTIYVRQIQRALGLGRDRWRRIRKELEAGGYYSITRTRGEGGHWVWTHTVYDSPRTLPPGPGRGTDIVLSRNPGEVSGQDAMSGSAMDGKPDDGQSSGGQSSDIRLYTSHLVMGCRSSSSGRILEDGLVVSHAGNDRPSAAATEKDKLRRTHPSGVVYWYDVELREIESLVTEHGEDAVSNAVRILVDRGQEPYVSRVSGVLMAQRARVHCERLAQRAVSAPQESAIESARKLVADMRVVGCEPSEDLLAIAGKHRELAK